MKSPHHPGIATEFVIVEHERDWYTTYHGNADFPIMLSANSRAEARAEAADYWGMDLQEIKYDPDSTQYDFNEPD